MHIQNFLNKFNHFKSFFFFRRGTGAYAKENIEEDTGKTGYKLRETDNRLNRLKNRQKTTNKTEISSVPSECGSDSNSRCSSVTGANNPVTPLSMRELRQKGLTKYDAELLLAQGCKFSDIAADEGKLTASMGARSEALEDRESRLHARNLRKTCGRKRDSEESREGLNTSPGSDNPPAETVTNMSGMSLRNHKRLSEPLLDTSCVMREKINNNNNEMSQLCSRLEKTRVGETVETKPKRTVVSKKENDKAIAFVNRVSKRRKSVLKNVSTVLESVYAPISRSKRVLNGKRSRYNSFNESMDINFDQVSVKSEMNDESVTSDSSRLSLSTLDVSSVKQEFGSELKQVLKNTKDIYEFDDQEYETSEPVSLRRCKVEERRESSECSAVKTESSSEPSTPEKQTGGPLKLTLRVKRSPIVEVSQSGENWNSGDPEYEVLRMEGVGDLEDEDSHRRKKHKNKDRERRRRKFRQYLHFDDAQPGTYSLPQPPMKRLRLILGGETQTINFSQVPTAVS